jgi:hypothetical protein
MADMYGTPYTEALHAVERYRLLDSEAAKEAEERGQREIFRIQRPSDPGFARSPDYKGKGLQLEFIIEDEGAFTMPWSAAITYHRPLGEWPEMIRADAAPDLFNGRESGCRQPRSRISELAGVMPMGCAEGRQHAE